MQQVACPQPRPREPQELPQPPGESRENVRRADVGEQPDHFLVMTHIPAEAEVSGVFVVFARRK